jgi:hypothetical protein
VATSRRWPPNTVGRRIAIAERTAVARDSVRLSCRAVRRITVRYSGKASTGPAPAAAWTAKTAAIPTRGATRRARPRSELDTVRGEVSGNASETSPPLAGWKVRRWQSVPAHLSTAAVLSPNT